MFITGPKGRVESIDVEFQSTSLKWWFLGNWIPKGGSDTPIQQKEQKWLHFGKAIALAFEWSRGKIQEAIVKKEGWMKSLALQRNGAVYKSYMKMNLVTVLTKWPDSFRSY